MIISRDIEAKIQAYLDSPELHSNVLLVHGARQVGKTLICTQVLSRLQQTRPCTTVNLEERPDLKLAMDECRSFSDFVVLLKTKLGFDPGNNAVLFIDEAQESKALGGFVRFMKEKWPHTKCILTGSSMSRLFDKDARIPVGRTQSVVVRPCTFREFLRAKDLEATFDLHLKMQASISTIIHEQLLKIFDEYLLVGGLPAAVVAHVEGGDYRQIQAMIFASQRDDFYRKEKLKEHLFTDAMKTVARQLGNSSMLSHITPSHRDARHVVEALKAWNLLLEIEQTGSAPTQSFHPKWYLYDLGILTFLRLGALPTISLLDTLDPALRTPLGGIVENAVLLQIQALEMSKNYQKVFGWKKNHKQGIEVDFVINQTMIDHEKIYPIEVKASQHINSHDVSNLKHFLQFSGLKKAFVMALERPKTIKLESAEIEVIPIYCELA